jgi:hypothetical protein
MGPARGDGSAGSHGGCRTNAARCWNLQWPLSCPGAAYRHQGRTAHLKPRLSASCRRLSAASDRCWGGHVLAPLSEATMNVRLQRFARQPPWKRVVTGPAPALHKCRSMRSADHARARAWSSSYTSASRWPSRVLREGKEASHPYAVAAASATWQASRVAQCVFPSHIGAGGACNGQPCPTVGVDDVGAGLSTVSSSFSASRCRRPTLSMNSSSAVAPSLPR